MTTKRRFPEDNLQMAVARYLDYDGAWWFHVANERKSTQKAGVRLKKKGVKSGVPDVIIIDPNKKYVGLVVELKIKPNKVTEDQRKWLERFSKRGYAVRVAYSFDEFLKIYENYKADLLI